MAEFRRLPTQQELQQILFMQGLKPQTNQQILQQNLAPQTVTPIPENVFQKIAGGARAAGEFVNRAGTAADVAKLFPGYTGQTQVNIPTSFNFAPKQAPTGEIIPQGLQTQPFNVNQILQAIKPADVLGISGAERAYSDIGMGKAPKPLDVVDTLALGAGGLAAGKAAVKGVQATKGLPVGMSIQDVGGLLKEAPRSPLGFYSALEDTALNLQRNKGTGQAFLNDLQKGANVKAEEIKWIGLDDYLKDKPNVTKQEVQDYIANNRVDVQEVQSPVGESIGTYDYRKWQLPGGENYREILLTMPTKVEDSPSMAKLRSTAADMNVSQATREAAQEQLDNIIKRKTAESGFRSTHFNQPNILAHLRVNDRVDADGKKMLLIEEVQSDWHQAGREKGYREPVKTVNELPKNYEIRENKYTTDANEKYYVRDDKGVYSGAFGATPEEAKAAWINAKNQKLRKVAETSNADKVPDAPFKDSWYQLALKRAIQYAAENGYERIGLTTGRQQADRFDLSKQVDGIFYSKNDDGTFNVSIAKGDKEIWADAAAKPEKLNEVIGKEVAKKIIEGEGVNEGGINALRGLDLQVGGEGMKKYYDEIYPKFLDKYGKKWGARVGETKVNAEGAQEPIRYLDVTPEMKASVSKGQPLFQAIPAIPAAGLLAPQEERK